MTQKTATLLKPITTYLALISCARCCLTATAVGVCLMLILTGCYYNVEEELYPSNTCNMNAVTFSATIQPILTRNCTSCHTGPAGNAGVDLSTHAGAAAVAANGKLVGVTTHAAGFPPMPQGASKLPECNINQIKKWVEDGAPAN